MNCLSFANLSAARRKLSKLGSVFTAELGRFNQEEAGLDIIEKILVLFVCVVILLGLLMYFDQTLWVTVKAKVASLLGSSTVS